MMFVKVDDTWNITILITKSLCLDMQTKQTNYNFELNTLTPVILILNLLKGSHNIKEALIKWFSMYFYYISTHIVKGVVSAVQK